MNAVRPWRIWFMPCAVAMSVMPLAMTALGAAPGIEVVSLMLAMPFAVGLMLRMLLGNPLVSLVPQHRAVQIRVAVFIGLPMALALGVPVQIGRGMDPLDGIGVAAAQAIMACLVGYGLHQSGWSHQLRQLALCAGILGLEVAIHDHPEALPGPALIVAAGTVCAFALRGRLPGIIRTFGEASTVGPPHRNGSSDPSTRWAERTRRWSGPAFAFAVGLAAPALIAAIAPSFPVESSSVLSLIAALSVPGMAAWNRCTPWLRSAMLGQVVTLTAGWPLPRRSWGWMVLFRLAAQATPDALAAALGVALGCLLVDPGGHGAFLATVVVAGCLPLVAVAVLLATTLMAGDWAAWTVGGMLLALGGPALIQAVPMDRPVQAVAILAVTVVPMLAVATIVQARRIAGREW